MWAPGTTTVNRLRIFRALASFTEITNPIPTLAAVTPTVGRAGVPLDLTLSGTGFNARSVVRWNGADIASIAESTTQIRVVVPAASLVVGTHQVSVFNPQPGGGLTGALPVDILPPPGLSIDQTSVGPGAPVTVTLTNGYGGQLDWIALASTSAPNGNYEASTFVGAGVTSRAWTIQAPAAPGPYEFRLFLNNGFVRVATSPTVTVDAAISPAPVLASISPAEALAGSPSLTMTLYGSQFTSSSVATWNGSPRPTTFVNSTQLQAAIAASDLTTAGAVPIAVVTPAPGGGTSAARTFTVNAAPVLTTSATTVVAGATVTVTLTNGLGGSLDWLAFAPTTAANNTYAEFTYVGAGVTSRTWTVTAPSTAGT
jgi:hypothetical protein